MSKMNPWLSSLFLMSTELIKYTQNFKFQTENSNHTWALVEHTVPSWTCTSDGQNSLAPSQYSARSHTPCDGRHSIAMRLYCVREIIQMINWAIWSNWNDRLSTNLAGFFTDWNNSFKQLLTLQVLRWLKWSQLKWLYTYLPTLEVL